MITSFKITYIELENYAAIYTAMNTYKISIDLSKSHNRVVLLCGANGSGKTAILSTLHPFATSGNIDNRPDSEMILQNKDGYKEIRYIYNTETYIIKHHYYWSKPQKITKSYIMRNDIELNPNGNVTSFRDIIEAEFGISTDFLKLLRLGNNVNTFVKSDSYNRNIFMNKILSDLDVYSMCYKNVTAHSREIATNIKILGERIARLQIHDIDLEINQLNELICKRKHIENIIESINREIGIDTGNLDSYKDANLETLDKHNSAIDVVRTITDIYDIDELHYKNKKLTEQIEQLKHKISIVQQSVSIAVMKLEQYSNEKVQIETNLKYILSEANHETILSEFNKVSDRYNNLSRKFAKFSPNFTRADILLTLTIGQSIYDEYITLNTISTDIIVDTINMIDDNIDVVSYCYKNMKNIPEIQSASSTHILIRPSGCMGLNCDYIKFYNSMSFNSDTVKIKKPVEYYESMLIVNSVIMTINKILKSNAELFNRMPFSYFKKDVIYDAIIHHKLFYDESDITKYITTMEEYESMETLKSQINTMQRELDLLNGSIQLDTSLKKQLVELNKNIIVLKKEHDDLITNMQLNISDLDRATQELNDNNFQIENMLRLKDAMNVIEQSKSIVSNIERISNQIKLNDANLIRYRSELTSIQTTIQSLDSRIQDYKNTMIELNELNRKVEVIDVIKKSLSPTTGIPLIFMSLYLGNMLTLINNLLDVVYDGDLQICDFIIDKKFMIPYKKHNILIDDISRASGGEDAFISIAISFAIVAQNAKNYNIMLFDEVDGPLDYNNRELFIKILEEQLNIINASQVFLITHNDVFDNYPVDIIKTSDIETDKYVMNTIIPIQIT